MVEVHNQDVMPLKAVKTLLKVAVAQGYDIQTLLTNCGLDFNPLDEHVSDQGVVSTLLYSRLYKEVMEILQDESFGLNSHTKSPPGTFRMMCLFIIHCKNLEKALVRSAEFFDYIDRLTHNATAIRQPITYEQQGQIAVCRFYNPNIVQTANNIQADASVLYMMHRLCSWLIGKPIELQEVTLIGRKPDNQDSYRKLFPCAITFDARENAIKFASQVLENPIVQTEESLRDFLRTAPYQLVSTRHDTEGEQLTLRIRQLLSEELHGECLSIEDVADRLNVSSRTIHRRLQKEGSSFQQLKDEVRQEAAVAYLSRPELTVNAIAMLMGFHDTSAFYRAFKKWTGKSPGEFRKQES